MIQIWKMPLKSGRGDFLEDPDKAQRVRDFCFSEGWVGIGWEIDSLSDGITDPKVYEEAIWCAPKEFNSKPALQAHRALAHTLQFGDLVWCRAYGNIYWIGRVTGPWLYKNTEEFDEFDLYQVRKCSWHRIGPSDATPGPIKNAYAGRGMTISQIRRERVAAAYESSVIWRKVSGEAIDQPAAYDNLSLSAVGHDDLEDIVALYLQSQGWLVVISTVKHATPITECVFRNSQNQRAYLQVKSGQTKVDINIEVPQDIDKFFVFDLLHEPAASSASAKVVRISISELEDFIRTHKFLLPPYLQHLKL
jgi:hypothetical protein